MKALILAAGKATRLRPLTHVLPKPILPLANKPILLHILEQIKEADITQIGIVVSPEMEPAIREVAGDGSSLNVQITYTTQSPQRGLAHAVQVSREFLGDSPFLMFLGDNVIEEGVARFVQEFKFAQPDALILLKQVPDPRAFGVAELDSSGRVVKLVEKPKEPKSNLAMVGGYFFTPGIHQAIEQIKPSWRNELEITDAIQTYLDMGKEIKSHILKGRWLDIGKLDDLLEANHFMLDTYIEPRNKGHVDAESRIEGKVFIAENTIIENSIIHGPVSIAESCRINSSIIGPSVSVGKECIVERSSLDNSLILDSCRIHYVRRLANSVIGRKAEVVGNKQNLNTLRLMLSDDARVELT